MCLSTVYANSMADNNILMKNVMSVTCDGDVITLTDLMERSQSFSGTLKSANLVDGYVIIQMEQ